MLCLRLVAVGSQFGALDMQLARAMLEVAFSRLALTAEHRAAAEAEAQQQAQAAAHAEKEALRAELEGVVARVGMHIAAV